MINAVYHAKPLILINAVSDTVFDVISAVYHDKPFILIGVTFGEKHISHHRAVYEADSYLALVISKVLFLVAS